MTRLRGPQACSAQDDMAFASPRYRNRAAAYHFGPHHSPVANLHSPPVKRTISLQHDLSDSRRKMAKRVGVDKWIFFTTLLLVVVGLVMVFSASAVVAAGALPLPLRLRHPPGALGPRRHPHHDRALARGLRALQLAALHLSRAHRHHPAARHRPLLSRLAPHPSLDPLRRLLYLPAL